MMITNEYLLECLNSNIFDENRRRQEHNLVNNDDLPYLPSVTSNNVPDEILSELKNLS